MADDDAKQATKTEPQMEPRGLDALRPHPRQQEIFGDVADHEIEELAASIGSRGLDHPIEILPNGRILRGHQRVRALRRLGKYRIRGSRSVRSRGRRARVELAFLEDNLIRRNLGKLALARGYQALRDLQRRRWIFPWRDRSGRGPNAPLREQSLLETERWQSPSEAKR
jgi:hypothetical protein